MIFLTIGIGLVCIGVLTLAEKRREELAEEIAEIREQAKEYDTY